MPFDSNGNASVQRNRAVTGQTVEAAQVNIPFDDVQSMLSQVYVKSGVAPLTGNMNFNGFKPTNVGDPSADGDAANKNYVDDSVSAVSGGISANARKIETLSAARNIVLADKSTFFRVTNSITLPLTAAATLGDDFWFQVQAINGNVIIDPDGAELINGQSTFIIQQGQVADIFCDVNQFRAYVYGDTLSGAQLQGYSFGLTLSNNAGDAANDIDVTSGKAAADTSPFNLMLLNSAITKRIDAAWAVGSGNGGLDSGSVADGTYYIWLIQRSDTGVTDALFSLSGTAPTMPTNYDRKRLIGSLLRSSSVNSSPNSALRELPFISAQQTYSNGGLITLAHGFSQKPANVLVELVCVNAENGFAVGESIYFSPAPTNNGAFQAAVSSDTANIYMKIGNSGLLIIGKTSGNNATLTPANWRIVLRAYKG